MGFRTGSFASVWSVRPGRGNFTDVRLSVSRKNKDTGAYEQDFSGFCTFIGHAHAKATQLKERDRIKLLDVDVSTVYDKEKAKEYINYKVFDFEMADYPPDARLASTSFVSSPMEGDIDENALPF